MNIKVPRHEHVHLDESLIIYHILTQSRANGTIVDVGVHTGTVSIPFLQSGWEVIGFEPNPLNSKHFFNKIKNYKLDDSLLTFSEKALSDTPKDEQEFFFSDVSSGISGLSAFHSSHKILQNVEVSTLKIELDGFLNEDNNIDFLKIDTEGYDLFVLQGFDWANRRHPDIIECEFEDSKTIPLGYTSQQQIDFLSKLGYSVLISEWHPIVEYGKKHDWHSLRLPTEQAISDKAWGNLIAFKQPELEETIINEFKKWITNKTYYTPVDNIPHSLGVHESGTLTRSEDRYTLHNEEAYLRMPFRAHFLPGASIQGLLKVHSLEKSAGTLILIRHGKGKPEATRKDISLQPGINYFEITHTVQSIQEGFGIQIHCAPGATISPRLYKINIVGAPQSSLFLKNPGLDSIEKQNDQKKLAAPINASILNGHIAELGFKLNKFEFLDKNKRITFGIDLLSKIFDNQFGLNAEAGDAVAGVLQTVIRDSLVAPGRVIDIDIESIDDSNKREGKFVKCVIVEPGDSVEITTSKIETDDEKVILSLECDTGTLNVIQIEIRDLLTNSRFYYNIDCSNKNRIKELVIDKPALKNTVMTMTLRNTSSESPDSNNTIKFFGGEVVLEKIKKEGNTLQLISQTIKQLTEKTKHGAYLLPTPTGEPLELADIEAFSRLHNRFAGKRIFIMGNGPSLNRTPLDKLEDEYVFGVNRVSLLFDRVSWRPQFFTAFDVRVVPDNAEEFKMIDIEHMFFSARYKNLMGLKKNNFWYHTKGFYNGFDSAFEPSVVYSGFGGGGSIGVIAIEIAFYLGFDPIYLIGTDVSYKVKDSVKQEGQDEFGDGVKLELTSTTDDDDNHFDPRYYGAGKKWHNPNVRDMKIGFGRAYSYMNRRDRTLLNATVGGELDTVPRIDIQKLFS